MALFFQILLFHCWYDFCILICIQKPCYNLLISSRLFCQLFWIFYMINLSVNKNIFISSLTNCIPFISFSCLIAWAKTFNMMLHRNGKKGCCCLVTSRVRLSFFAILWTVAPLGFSDHGIFQTGILELPFLSPRDLPNPGIEPVSPAFRCGPFTAEPPGKPQVQC